MDKIGGESSMEAEVDAIEGGGEGEAVEEVDEGEEDLLVVFLEA
jgi:hypothetical protein